MQKKNTNNTTAVAIDVNITSNTQVQANSAIELVNWPPASLVSDKILAFQTTRHPFTRPLNLLSNGNITEDTIGSSDNSARRLADTVSPYKSFNLGLHVGDNERRVLDNREKVCAFIANQLSDSLTRVEKPVKIQWLNQVHGSQVAEVEDVLHDAITADACITRKKNVALAIMTADCLPILLCNNTGTEIAAIHGGWRPLAANIIGKTLAKMHSKATKMSAWLGPCIGNTSFEVGVEVKAQFLLLSQCYHQCFVKQDNGKYLADLQRIATIQLNAFGVSIIANQAECTYLKTDKYYSYRKEQTTGRMASIICRK